MILTTVLFLVAHFCSVSLFLSPPPHKKREQIRKERRFSLLLLFRTYERNTGARTNEKNRQKNRKTCSSFPRKQIERKKSKRKKERHLFPTPFCYLARKIPPHSRRSSRETNNSVVLLFDIRIIDLIS